MAAEDADIVVVGAGIAGASFGCFAAAHARVLLLEREPYPGMHATGRSAAMYSATYGSAQVRALTRASRPFFDAPPAGFAAQPLLRRRGALVIGNSAQAAAVHALHAAVQGRAAPVQLLDGAAVRQRVPVLESHSAVVGLLEPDAADIDVNELHQGYLRQLRAHGGRVDCSVAIDAIERVQDRWVVHANGQRIRAPLLVNAAGAWADEVAALAGVARIGLQPRRRSAFLFAAPPGLAFADWPLVIDADETYYFKPDAGLLLGSCANADPVPPHDVQPEELDIALGIHRIEAATTLRIRRPTRTWAGLRSFVTDGDLVGGFAPDAPGFFWIAAQGGYGIQTSAAMGLACAHLALGLPLPGALQDEGLTAAMLAVRSPGAPMSIAADD